MPALTRHAIIGLLAASCTSGACGTAARPGSPAQDRPARVSADRVWLVLVDDLHLDFRNSGYLRRLLKAIANELIADADMFAVASTGPSSLSIGLTTNRAALEPAIRKASGAGLGESVVDVLLRGREPNEIGYRASVALSAASGMVAGAEDVRSPRKALIYISNGYLLDPNPYGRTPADGRSAREREMAAVGLRRQFSQLIRQARRAGVRIFSIDQRAPTPASNVDHAVWEAYRTAARESLRVLSERTGGVVLRDGTDDAGTVQRIRSAMR